MNLFRVHSSRLASLVRHGFELASESTSRARFVVYTPRLAHLPPGELRIHPAIKNLYFSCGTPSASKGSCAKAKALSRALYDGNSIEDLRGSTMVAITLESLTIKAPCHNCASVLAELGVRGLTRK